MHKLHLSSHGSSHQVPLSTDRGLSQFTSLGHHSSLATYFRNALQILSEHDLAIAEFDRLTLIVKTALTAQSLFFAAALHDPDTAELYDFFEEFVLRCVSSSRKREVL
jgi:hypothetical protein